MFKTKKEKEIKEEKEKLKTEMDDVQVPVTDSNDKENNDEREDVDELSKEEQLQKQAESLREQLLRKAAEFENYKRRTENDLSSLYKFANEGLIRELLPVLDDFERVINSWNDKHDAEIFRQGTELVFEKFKKILQKQGLKEIDALNKHFDVNLHEAVMQITSDKAEPNTVTEIAEKGYMLKDKIIRHAKVVVSKPEEDN